MAAAYGDVIVLDGIQKNVIDCNWKIAVDNLFDWYHVMYSHASANSTGFVDLAQILHPDSQLVILGEYGHGIGGPGIPKPMQDQPGRRGILECQVIGFFPVFVGPAMPGRHGCRSRPLWECPSRPCTASAGISQMRKNPRMWSMR